MSRFRLLVDLDVTTAEQAVRLAKTLRAEADGFVVGGGLLYGAGPVVAAAVVDLGAPVFVDAGLFGPPDRVAAAVDRLVGFGARWISVAAMAGEDALGAAAGAAAPSGGIVAVTVPGHLDNAGLAAMGFGSTRGRLTARLGRLAAASGCEGAWCAATELGVLAGAAPALCRFTTGDAGAPDPVPRGADYVIVGGAIVDAADPAGAAAEFRERAGGERPDRVPQASVEGDPCPRS